MQFSLLRTLFCNTKQTFTLKSGATLASAAPRAEAYIEPTLKKIIFDFEKPSVLLIAAVGASGKSAMAQVLATHAGVPLLDLSKHKAVGDSTITGLLTNSFAAVDLSGVFESLHVGTYGLVIDGLDEGRAKTTEQSFEAFLDDIAALCNGSARPTFVLLGRTAIVDTCWLYLESKGVRTGMLSLEPFDRSQAHDYIDRFSKKAGTPHSIQYSDARDKILDCLSAAFSVAPGESSGTFLSFIGYPPVLDAVATVLREESNFFKLKSEVVSHFAGDREIELLESICVFILTREQTEKVWVNVLRDLCVGLSESDEKRIKMNGFCVEEQCYRLLAFCLGRPISYAVFNDSVLDAKLQEQLEGVFADHPFLKERNFRNAVFEAFVLAKAYMSARSEFVELAAAYLDLKRPTYHLVYMCHSVGRGAPFPTQEIRALVGASLDFRSRRSDVELTIDGIDSEEELDNSSNSLSVSISISTASQEDSADLPRHSRIFKFKTGSYTNNPIDLGGTLADAFVYVPGSVVLRSSTELRLIGPLALFCGTLILDAPSMSVSSRSGSTDALVIMDSEFVNSSLRSLSISGAKLDLNVTSAGKLGYPLVAHLSQREFDNVDPDVKRKYLRLRKILTHFRSHSKGRLAKYTDKVEHERVGGNAIGAAVLERLISDGVLYKEGNFYFVQPSRLNSELGVSWTDLRGSSINSKLNGWLRTIQV